MKKKKSSLIKKTSVWIVLIATFIGTVAIAIYNRGLYNAIVAQYEHYSIDITKLVASQLDLDSLAAVKKDILDIYDHSETKVWSDEWGTPEFDAYLSQYSHIKETDAYKKTHADLQKMQDQLDVDCLYLDWMDLDNKCYIYLVDAAHEGECPPGCIDPIYLDDPSVFGDPSNGSIPNITNTPEYGWLMSTSTPILDKDGKLLAFIAADISMDEAMAELKHFMFYIGLTFILMDLLVCVLALFLIAKFIVSPLNKLSKAAEDYRNNKIAFSELGIKRNDEIGILVDSMIQMEKDIDGYVSDILSTRQYADRMDREANIDPLTNVRSKRAYDMEIKKLNEGNEPYGIAMIDMNDLKGINDSYGHEKGDISIQTVCRIICRVFAPSSVYRIGGDEFVVILKNSDYQNSDSLIRTLSELFRLNKLDDSLSPWERVSAAVGYALCDPDTEDSAENVINNADTAMYKNKRVMKNEE